jgi:hypothetical protein
MQVLICNLPLRLSKAEVKTGLNDGGAAQGRVHTEAAGDEKMLLNRTFVRYV